MHRPGQESANVTWTLRSLAEKKMRQLERTRGSNEEVFKSRPGVIVTRRRPQGARQMEENLKRLSEEAARDERGEVCC